ncbi:hypothetical protein Goshw_002624, partial [Gossypium schwendimanii]|nr:hypothetical protein [Gossypium schwendimanii]
SLLRDRFLHERPVEEERPPSVTVTVFVGKTSLKVMIFSSVCDKSAAKGHDL